MTATRSSKFGLHLEIGRYVKINKEKAVQTQSSTTWRHILKSQILLIHHALAHQICKAWEHELHRSDCRFNHSTCCHGSHTSRKHGKKEPQSFSHCGSFDHHAMQSLNNCRFVFLDLPTNTFGILGVVIHRWKGLQNIFRMVYHTPQKHLILQSQNEK